MYSHTRTHIPKLTLVASHANVKTNETNTGFLQNKIYFLNLQGEQHKESYHDAKQAHGLRQGKAEDGVREKLLLQRGVSWIADY